MDVTVFLLMVDFCGVIVCKNIKHRLLLCSEEVVALESSATV